ncbi:MAG: PHP domain-containing protein [Clostridia bacterium]|nr:PHP domain-containing protein [Clostridia bacterium]
MILTADYHTHTKYSHGKGTVYENALSAKEKGLIELGICDHGFNHPAFGLRKNKISAYVKDCIDATLTTSVNVKVGIEANIIGTDGSVDFSSKFYDKFDLFFAGVHKFVLNKPSGFFNLFCPGVFNPMFKNKPSKRVVAEQTKTYINVIKKNPVDAITHLNFGAFADPVEVAKVCADYGTYLELNSKKVHLTDEELSKILDTGVRFIISSDAHSTNRIAEIALVEEMVKRLNFPLDRIDNIDGRLPNFRFKRFKEGK